MKPTIDQLRRMAEGEFCDGECHKCDFYADERECNMIAIEAVYGEQSE